MSPPAVIAKTLPETTPGLAEVLGDGPVVDFAAFFGVIGGFEFSEAWPNAAKANAIPQQATPMDRLICHTIPS